MRRRTLAAALAAAASLLIAPSAFGADYRVTGTADTSAVPCGAPDAEGFRPCPSLRQAVTEANVSPDVEDNILLTETGTYSLTQGELVLQNGVSIFGLGARSIRIENTTGRVLHVPPAAQVVVAGVTIAEGFVTSDDGANILNEGDLELFQVRVTGGQADNGNGGGITNAGGHLTVIESLIDGNTATFAGGGIDNEGLQGNPAELEVMDSTIAGNSGSTGGGITTGGGGAANTVELLHVTFNLNLPGGALGILNAGQTVTTLGSIFTTNVPTNPNCSAIKPTDLGYNLDRGTSCAFTPGLGSVSSADPLVSGGLRSLGGGTDVFSIEPTSPAANLVAQCGSPFDQRGYLRTANPLEPCDAGAYEIGGTPFLPEGEPTPEPTPPTPAEPIPTPVRAVQTPVPPVTPAPVTGQSVAAAPVSGTVLVKLPGSNKFVPLNASVIKNGAEIDTRKGVVEITRSDGSKAKFYDGIFKLSQPGGITTLTLSEKLDCKKQSRASAAQKKPKTRKLWGDGKGKFRTKGQYSAATIRGTKWLVQDTCTTTLTRVTEGSVLVRDEVKKKNVVLRKGKRYTARAKG